MPIRLDERLTAIATLVEGGIVADVGCDHGKLSYYLVSTERVERAIVTDISAESLKKARELAIEGGVEDLMPARLGDGLAPIASGEADVVIIAGLGGDVISGILERAFEDGKKFESYILSPNTHAEKVRETLVKIGQKISSDSAVECGGKLYPVIRSEAGEQSLDELQTNFGAFYMTDVGFEKRARKELEYVRGLLAGGASSDKLRRRAEMLEQALYNIKMRDKL